jgi:hypothetical protein
MRRPCADREEKRVTRGNEKDPQGGKLDQDSLTSTTPIRERLLERQPFNRLRSARGCGWGAPVASCRKSSGV